MSLPVSYFLVNSFLTSQGLVNWVDYQKVDGFPEILE